MELEKETEVLVTENLMQISTLFLQKWTNKISSFRSEFVSLFTGLLFSLDVEGFFFRPSTFGSRK